MIYSLFYDFFKNHIGLTAMYMSTMFYIPLNSLALPHLYGKLISKLKDGVIDTGVYFMVLLVILWTFIQSIKLLSSYLHYQIFPKFTSYIRGKLVSIIIQRYKTNYEDLEIGDTITKIIKTPWLLEEIFDIVEAFIFRNTVVIFSSFIYLFYYNKTLGIIYIICILLVILVCKIYVSACKKHVIYGEKTYDSVHEEIEDLLSNLISVYTAQKTDFEQKKLDKLNKEVYTSEQSINECNNNYKIIFAILYILIFIILNFYSIYLYKDSKISLEILIAIIIINYSLLNSLMNVYYYSKKLSDIMGRTKVFLDYIDKLPNSSKDNKLKLDKLKNITISLKDLQFQYVKNKNIINNINLEVKDNDIIGLIGHIGSGKSTLGKLLIRLKNPSSGGIYLNNVNIHNLNIDNLRHIINYIPQHPKLFNRTLFNNIVYSIKRDITEKDIYKVLDDLGVKDAQKKFKSIMYKNVGKNGSNLSGGQRQLVWLIRAILKDSKVVILDEPTSSLDNVSKKQVIKFIKNYSKDKIIILITHDKSLLKYVNRIIELKNGTVLSDVKQKISD